MLPGLVVQVHMLGEGSSRSSAEQSKLVSGSGTDMGGAY